MQAEVLSGLIGFGGALVGGAASFGGVWLTLSHQRKQAREARLMEIGQVATDKALNELIALNEFLGSVRGNDVVTIHTDERLPYLDTVFGHLKKVELAVTRIPDQSVRDRMKMLLRLASHYRSSGVRHYFALRWFRDLAEDMVEVLSAHVRHDTIPAVSKRTTEKQQKTAAQDELQRQYGRDDDRPVIT
ncbi:hypothetical protein ACF06T_09200 [Streptomyces albidoflavus]